MGTRGSASTAGFNIPSVSSNIPVEFLVRPDTIIIFYVYFICNTAEKNAQIFPRHRKTRGFFRGGFLDK